MIPVVITPYSSDPTSLRQIRQLLDALDHLAMVAEAIPLADLRDSDRQQPRLIRDAMLRWEGQPINWIGPGAQIRKKPLLFSGIECCDLAFHLRDGHVVDPRTMYFGGGAASWQLVEQWLRLVRDEPTALPYQLLEQILADQLKPGGRSLQLENLPATYAACLGDGRCCSRDIIIEFPPMGSPWA